ILTLRTLALSTYENRRVSTGALILGPGADHGAAVSRHGRPAALEALDSGVDPPSLKSLHRLCDGRRTLFLVDRQGKLADLVESGVWARGEALVWDVSPAPAGGPVSEPAGRVPCARAFAFHAMATSDRGHV